jgi:hypothetical protein
MYFIPFRRDRKQINMKKTFLYVILVIMSVILSSLALAASEDSVIDKIMKGEIKLTKDWKTVADNVKCRDNGKEYQCEFIHVKDNSAKPATKTTCTKSFAKWNLLPVNYAINPTNSQGLTSAFVTSAISTAAGTWDAATSKNLFNPYSVDTTAEYGIRDYKNSIAIGAYSGSSSTIAVTSIWFTKRTGILEFDMLFNTYYRWGDATTNPSLMDLQNIATHELGHAVGLDDIYTASCSYVTMYGYSNYGDISKRTLEQPDITGLQKMYGV